MPCEPTLPVASRSGISFSAREICAGFLVGVSGFTRATVFGRVSAASRPTKPALRLSDVPITPLAHLTRPNHGTSDKLLNVFWFSGKRTVWNAKAAGPTNPLTGRGLPTESRNRAIRDTFDGTHRTASNTRRMGRLGSPKPDLARKCPINRTYCAAMLTVQF